MKEFNNREIHYDTNYINPLFFLSGRRRVEGDVNEGAWGRCDLCDLQCLTALSTELPTATASSCHGGLGATAPACHDAGTTT